MAEKWEESLKKAQELGYNPKFDSEYKKAQNNYLSIKTVNEELLAENAKLKKQSEAKPEPVVPPTPPKPPVDTTPNAEQSPELRALLEMQKESAKSISELTKTVVGIVTNQQTEQLDKDKIALLRQIKADTGLNVLPELLTGNTIEEMKTNKDAAIEKTKENIKANQPDWQGLSPLGPSMGGGQTNANSKDSDKFIENMTNSFAKEQGVTITKER